MEADCMLGKEEAVQGNAVIRMGKEAAVGGREVNRVFGGDGSLQGTCYYDLVKQNTAVFQYCLTREKKIYIIKINLELQMQFMR